MIENKFTETSQFDGKMKMTDIIHINYHLLTVLNRFGIKLGFGDKTIEKTCNDYKIDTNFFLLIINSFHNSEYDLNTINHQIDSEKLIDYLFNTHQYYSEVIIPALDQLITELQSQSIDKTKTALLQRFYRGYIRDLKEHIEYENLVAFPYILMLSKVYNNEIDKSEMSDITYRISNFVENHTNIEDQLFDLKNILIKYYSVPNDDTIIHALFLLFRFETDLRNHALLENELMVSLVREMEKKVFES